LAPFDKLLAYSATRGHHRINDPRLAVRLQTACYDTVWGFQTSLSSLLRRTFATLIQNSGTVEDAQTQLRHADTHITMNIYQKLIAASVSSAVEALERKSSEPNARPMTVAPSRPSRRWKQPNQVNRQKVKVDGSGKVGHPVHNFCTTFLEKDFRL
jgi:CHASE1-domain containing sensor protein